MGGNSKEAMDILDVVKMISAASKGAEEKEESRMTRVWNNYMQGTKSSGNSYGVTSLRV